jgi:hypothetical protein
MVEEPQRNMHSWRKPMDHAKKDAPAGDNKGQQKTYVITNPATGETRTVTQQQWREEKLGKAGWEKPADMPDEPEPTV